MSAHGGVFFDDFAYRDAADQRLAARGWTVRSGAGGPGVPGARWSTAAVTFPTVTGGQVLQLESSTDGTAAGTVHGELFQQNRFREGTYGARIRFSDVPVSGPRGDHVVQAFFTIRPLAFDLDPDYGELDLEYLPNGGWGESSSALFATSWETYRREPWLALNTQTVVRDGFAGWHEVTIQVAAGRMRYLLDGHLLADHGEPYYPEAPMSINANQWFIRGGLLATPASRSYRLQLDYVYVAAGRVLTPAEVAGQIAAYRRAGVAHVDTIVGSQGGGHDR